MTLRKEIVTFNPKGISFEYGDGNVVTGLYSFLSKSLFAYFFKESI